MHPHARPESIAYGSFELGVADDVGHKRGGLGLLRLLNQPFHVDKGQLRIQPVAPGADGHAQRDRRPALPVVDYAGDAAHGNQKLALLYGELDEAFHNLKRLFSVLGSACRLRSALHICYLLGQLLVPSV
jgi:hypothetical protein